MEGGGGGRGVEGKGGEGGGEDATHAQPSRHMLNSLYFDTLINCTLPVYLQDVTSSNVRTYVHTFGAPSYFPEKYIFSVSLTIPLRSIIFSDCSF